MALQVRTLKWPAVGLRLSLSLCTPRAWVGLKLVPPPDPVSERARQAARFEFRLKTAYLAPVVLTPISPLPFLPTVEMMPLSAEGYAQLTEDFVRWTKWRKDRALAINRFKVSKN